MNDGGFAHATAFRFANTMPVARVGSAVMCEQWSALSNRCTSNRE